MNTIGYLALGLYLAILLVKFALARKFIANHPETATLAAPVTVVQPILSGDPALEETLRTNLRQWAADGEDVRAIWLIDEDDPEGQRVAAAIGDSRVTVVVCPPPGPGRNPKTAKLQRALELVDTPYISIVDDDTILSPHHLGRAMHALQSCTLYTGLPCYLPGVNVWSSLVSHFVNNNSILTYLSLLEITKPLTINGMFYVMRTDELRKMGGFAPIASKLCDDYALAVLVREHGGTIRQGLTPQFLRTTVPDAKRYVSIMHRWFRFANVLLADQTIAMKLLLVFTLGLPPLFFALSFLTLAGGLQGPIDLAVGLLVRDLVIRNLHATALGRRSSTLQQNWFLSIASELLQPLHWMHAMLQHAVQWRTRRIRVARDGTFSYVGKD